MTVKSLTSCYYYSLFLLIGNMGLGEGYGADVDASQDWQLVAGANWGLWGCSSPPVSCTHAPALISLDGGDFHRKGLSHLFSVLSPLAEQGQAWTLDLPICLFPTSFISLISPQVTGSLGVSVFPEPCAGQLTQPEAQSFGGRVCVYREPQQF